MPIPIPDPPFSDAASVEVLRARMFSNMESGLDRAEGSLAWNLIAPFAIELAQLYESMDLLVEFGFVQGAYGQFLDARAEEHGVFRKEATKATGEVTFSGTNGTVVPAGTVVSTSTPPGSLETSVSFVTTEAGTVATGTVTVSVEALQVGLSGNVPAGSITRLVGLISGITGLTNAAETTGGANVESDDVLRERLLEVVSSFRGAGTADDYEKWALEVDGVGAATAEPVWSGPGTVRVMILDANRDPAGAPLIAEVDAYIEERRPIGADVTIATPSVVAVDVTVTLVLEPGHTVGSVTPALTEAIQAYFDQLDAGDDVILTEVGAAIVTTPGVADYSALQLEGAATNTAIATNQIAHLGTVTPS